MDNKNLKEALIFLDNRCPHCEDTLYFDYIWNKNGEYKFRYKCNNCGFTCPIYHDLDSNTIRPLYDSTIDNFLQNFGEDINEKRQKAINY